MYNFMGSRQLRHLCKSVLAHMHIYIYLLLQFMYIKDVLYINIQYIVY